MKTWILVNNNNGTNSKHTEYSSFRTFTYIHTYKHRVFINSIEYFTQNNNNYCVCVCVRLDVYFILMLLPEMIQCWLLWWWWSSSLLWNSSFGFYSKILLFIQSFSILDNGGDSLGPFRQRSNIEKRKKNHQSSFRIFYFYSGNFFRFCWKYYHYFLKNDDDDIWTKLEGV